MELGWALSIQSHKNPTSSMWGSTALEDRVLIIEKTAGHHSCSCQIELNRLRQTGWFCLCPGHCPWMPFSQSSVSFPYIIFWDEIPVPSQFLPKPSVWEAPLPTLQSHGPIPVPLPKAIPFCISRCNSFGWGRRVLSIVGSSSGLRPGFKTWLRYLLTVWSWATRFTSLSIF